MAKTKKTKDKATKPRESKGSMFGSVTGHVTKREIAWLFIFIVIGLITFSQYTNT